MPPPSNKNTHSHTMRLYWKNVGLAMYMWFVLADCGSRVEESV